MIAPARQNCQRRSASGLYPLHLPYI